MMRWIAGFFLSISLMSGANAQTGVISGATSTATGSTTARTLADRAADVVNAKDYGVKCDGTTDDTAAFRTLGALGKTIVFPIGICKVTVGAISLASGTKLLGAGPEATRIRPEALTGDKFIFGNANRVNLGASTTTPTTLANQTDSGYTIQGVGFDFSLFNSATAVSFLLARKISISNVRAYNGLLYASPGFSGFQFIGCDEVSVYDYTATNAVNALDLWKGTTRVKVSNVSFESSDAPGNGGLINMQGTGTIASDREHSEDLQITNATFWLHNAIALFLDSGGAGSQTTDVTLSNARIVAKTGTTTNSGVVGRGMGGRVKVRSVTFSADSGASFLQPVLLGGFFGYAGPTSGSGLVSTVSGSKVLTISIPAGTDVGIGNYISIDNNAGGALVGNGLSLSGYYLVTSVSGPATQTLSGNVVTAPATVNASGTGVIAGATHLQGYWGALNHNDLSDLTFDGVGATGVDLIHLEGSGSRVDGVTVTPKYNGSLTPQYRSIVGIDATLDIGNPAPKATEALNIIGEAGTAALQVGWLGNNFVTWQGLGLAPALGAVLILPILPQPGQ